MRQRSLRLKTSLYRQTPLYRREITPSFCRRAVYESVRILEQSLGIGPRLASLPPPSAPPAPPHPPPPLGGDLTLVDDRQIRELNRDYRHKDQATDVLSFPVWGIEDALPHSSPALLPLGDIIISLETAQRQALESGMALRPMVAWLIAHSMLHLLGFDHPTPKERQEMAHYELRILRALGFHSLPQWAQGE